MILECENNEKLFYMVFVGALNVGQITFKFENRVETNTNANEIKAYSYNNIKVRKGECLGYFKMGSTVAILWEKDFVILENLTTQNIKFGQRIGKIVRNK